MEKNKEKHDSRLTDLEINMKIDSDMEELYLSTVYVMWPCHASILIILNDIYYLFSSTSFSFSHSLYISISLTHTPILFVTDS